MHTGLPPAGLIFLLARRHSHSCHKQEDKLCRIPPNQKTDLTPKEQPNGGKTSEPQQAEAEPLTVDKAAALVKRGNAAVAPDEILSWREYTGRVVAITRDGQRLVGAK